MRSSILILLVMFAESFPSFVSRVENLSIPLFTGIVRAVDAILVDTKNKIKPLDEIKRRCDMDIHAPQVMVFPEGTCNNSHTLFRFNKGLFSLGKSKATQEQCSCNYHCVIYTSCNYRQNDFYLCIPLLLSSL